MQKELLFKLGFPYFIEQEKANEKTSIVCVLSN